MLRSAGHAVDVALEGIIGEEYAAVNLDDVILLDADTRWVDNVS